MISYDIKKQIVDNVDIVEVVGEYVKLIKKGNSNFCLCPFHDDKNPSMSVSSKVKMYNCFSCGAKGNVISFVSRFENISEDDACRKLAKRIGLSIKENLNNESAQIERLRGVLKEANHFYQFYLNNSVESQKALDYLHKRGINADIIQKFGIGLAPNNKDSLYKILVNKKISELDQQELGLISTGDDGTTHDVFRERIMFPLSDQFGNTVGFSGRIYSQSKMAKYINSNENALFHKGDILYNLHNAIMPARKKDRIYLFEGFMDVIAAYKANIDNGVATMGTALTQNHIRALLNITKNIVLCFDGDEAGVHAMTRSSSLLANYNIIPYAVVLPNNLDPDEYLKSYGKDALYTYLLTKAKPVYYWLYDVAYKKFVKGDLNSTEKFKSAVFDFLSYVKEQTIIDFYLEKLSADLEASIDSIKIDFSKIRRISISSSSTTGPNNVIDNLRKANIVIQNKNFKINKGLIKAYHTVIKHCIFDINDYQIYQEKTKNYVLDSKALINEYSILLIIGENAAEYNREKCVEQIKKDQNLGELLEKILNNNLIDEDNNRDFELNLKKIISSINKLDMSRSFNNALNGDLSAKQAFLEKKRDNN